jgi:hypothetical protein
MLTTILLSKIRAKPQKRWFKDFAEDMKGLAVQQWKLL